jgi:hypothetical protein
MPTYSCPCGQSFANAARLTRHRNHDQCSYVTRPNAALDRIRARQQAAQLQQERLSDSEPDEDENDAASERSMPGTYMEVGLLIIFSGNL